MPRPEFKNTYNVNTIVTVLSLVLTIAAGGAAYARLGGKSDQAYDKAMEVAAEVKTLKEEQSTIKSEVRLLSLKVEGLEKTMSNALSQISSQFLEANANFREVRDAVSKMSTQVEVSNQILRRVEQVRSSGTPRD